MATIDDINFVLRDFVGWDAQHPLPIGNPRTGVHDPTKRSLRQILISILQTMGDEAALQDILVELGSKADITDSGKFFASRNAASAVGQAALPAAIGRIITIEDGNLVVRGSGAANDPLFPGAPQWGVLNRFPSKTLLGSSLMQLAGSVGEVSTRGIDKSLVTGPAASDQVYLFAEPMKWQGIISQLKVFARGAGQMSLRVYSRNLNTWSLVRSQQVSVIDGYNDLETNLQIGKGQYLAIFPGTSKPAYVATAGPALYVGPDGPSFDSATQTLSLELQATVRVVHPDGRSDAMSGGVLGAVAGAEMRIAGISSAIVPEGPYANPRTYVIDAALPAGAAILMEAAFNIAGTVRVGRYRRAGNVFNRLDYQDVVVSAGVNAVELSMAIEAGDYLGLWGNGPRLKYVNASAVTGYYQSDLATDQPTFTGTFGGIELHARFSVLAAQAFAKMAEYHVDEIVTSVQAEQSANTLTLEAIVVSPSGQEVPRAGSVSFVPTATGLFRYDLVYLDHLTGQVLSRQGTPRAVDPENRKATVSASTETALAMVRVNDLGIASVTPLAPVRNDLPAAVSEEIEVAIRHARNRCPRFLAKVASRRSLRIVGFGDSITAFQAFGTPSYETPNGDFRDLAKAAYLATYPADHLATIPQFTAVQLGRPADDAGAAHTKVGWNWSLVAALERRGYVLGADLFYDNFGVGGQTTATAWDSEGNAPTTWLTSARALGADLVVIALGMNERGNPGTEGRMVSIIRSFKDAGSDVVVLEVPRPAIGALANWRAANASLRRAARYCGVGFIPLASISEDWAFSTLGVAPEEVCAANRNNHPGIVELQAYGRLLAKLTDI